MKYIIYFPDKDAAIVPINGEGTPEFPDATDINEPSYEDVVNV